MGLSDVGDKLPGLDEAKKSSEIERYADKAMFRAAPMKAVDEPKVYLLWMTEDPLGAIAAACKMYKGEPVYSLRDITDDERIEFFEQVQKTHLTAPLEFVKLHFFIEGVDRAFTHQLVRQRTAVYAQESLRFAVKENMASEVPYPPSLMDGRTAGNLSGMNDLQDIWDGAIREIEKAYLALIANGVPAEDARGLLPQAVTTRLHFCTDLRNLAEHAGNRLCTQAQFHWRSVFRQISTEISKYPLAQMHDQVEHDLGFDSLTSQDDEEMIEKRGWQFELISNSNLFAPICYKTGKCEFKANFDRGCTIRGRVDANENVGRNSSMWDMPFNGGGVEIEPISRSEWMEDARAGWVS